MRFLFTLLVLAFSLAVFGQADFRPGYVLHHGGDTTFGYINYKGYKSSARECQFKSSPDAVTKVYTADELAGYRFLKSKYFVAKKVDTFDQIFFFEYLINGVVDIYFLRSEIGDLYFIDNGDGVLRKLEAGEVVVESDYGRLVRRDTRYIGLLKSSFAKNSTISERAESASVNHQSLIRLARDYHAEVGKDESCIIYERETIQKKRFWGLTAAASRYQLSIESEGLPERLAHMKGISFEPSWAPAAGLFIRSNFPQLNEKLYFNFDLLASIRKVNGEVTRSGTGPGVVDHHQVKLKQSVLNGILTLRYEPNTSGLRPSFQAGCYTEFYLSRQFNYTFTRTFPWSDTPVIIKSTDNPFSKLDYGITAGLGIMSKPGGRGWSVELNYLHGVGLNMSGYRVNGNNLMLVARYVAPWN